MAGQGKKDTAKMVHVLIKDEKGELLRMTCVLKESVGSLHSTPTSRFQAMLQKVPEIETAIKSICKKIAKCKAEGTKELKNYFGLAVDGALRSLRSSGFRDWTEVSYGEEGDAEEAVRAAEERVQAAEARERAAANRERQAREAEAAAAECAAVALEHQALSQAELLRMSEMVARLQAEFAQAHQREEEARERANAFEQELDSLRAQQVEDHLDNIDLQMGE